MKYILGAFLAVIFSACRSGDFGEGVFQKTDCMVRQLVDLDSGMVVVGAEDLALTADGTALIVSAYDRLAVEAAVKAGAPLPDGGVYRVELAALLSGDVTVKSVIQPRSRDGGLRPHGIALSGNRLAVINRRAGEDGTQPVIEVYVLEGGGAVRTTSITSPALCAANDLAWQGEALLVTSDRKTCPGWSFEERVLGARQAKLTRLSLEGGAGDTETLSEGLAFANGVAVLPNGTIVVAETRGRSLRQLGPYGKVETIKAPGGPDNLSLSGNRLVAALQPNLLTFGLYRYGQRDKAPSRIALWQDGAAWRLLYEDTVGDQFSGATTGLVHNNVLVAGSARDAGLLVCRGGGL